MLQICKGENPSIAATSAQLLWHATPTHQCLALTHSSTSGLSFEEASSRLDRLGVNALPRQRRAGWLLLFLRQFRSPLIYLLLAAAALSIFVGDRTDAGFIFCVLLINALVGASQEQRAETSMEGLRKLICHSARVRRGGAVATIDAADLVVGDIIEVESGMAVPADARLLRSIGLRVDESTFSGESLPVHKDAGAIVASSAGLSDRSTMLYAGTTISEGRGTGVVVATGLSTALGSIEVSLMTSPAAEPPLVLRLHRLARHIAAGAVLLIASLAVLLGLQGGSAEHILFLSVALAVSAVPEGLPIAVTVALAAATSRMARRNVIIRSLPAVEGLGACTLIASDKTGTLTLNRLTVDVVVLRSGEIVEANVWRDGQTRAEISELAWGSAICNDAEVGRDGAIDGDSVDVALLRFAGEVGVDLDIVRSTRRLAAQPYEPALKFSSVLASEATGMRLYVKGAPETVLAMCADADREAARAGDILATGGYRMLAVATGDTIGADSARCAAPSGLRLLGFVGLLDPLRPEAAEAIERCTRAGISVRMITGDHPATALTIARRLGLAETMHEVMTGADMVRLMDSPAELEARVRASRIFARIEPAQKLRIVEILSASGEIVAVTGDGINDAPALQAADIGVAMGKGGTDVARGASDLVLADDNFASIVAGVEEGRVTYGNIRKIVIFLLATGIAEIFMFLGSAAAGLPMPLTAVQLLWANLVTNGAQDVMLGFGKGEGDELDRPPRRRADPLVDRSALALMLPPAAAMTLIALVLMDWSLGRGASLAEAQNLTLLLVVLFQNVYVLCMRSERRPLWREPLVSNPWLLLGVTLALALQLIAMHWQPLSDLLGTNTVGLHEVILCLGAAALVTIIAELTKSAVARSAERKLPI